MGNTFGANKLGGNNVFGSMLDRSPTIAPEPIPIPSPNLKATNPSFGGLISDIVGGSAPSIGGINPAPESRPGVTNPRRGAGGIISGLVAPATPPGGFAPQWGAATEQPKAPDYGRQVVIPEKVATPAPAPVAAPIAKPVKPAPAPKKKGAETDPYERWKQLGRPGGNFAAWKASQ